jgi:hypothetical protein
MDLNAITANTTQRKQVVRRRVPANMPALLVYLYEDEEEEWPKQATRD